MSNLFQHINELKAAEAFTKQAKIFDQLYSDNEIIVYKRERVREHILKYAIDNGSMLELNCGSGDDAIFFAQKNFHVHATDISEGMLDVLKEKINDNNYGDKISVEQCSFTELEFLENRGPYNHIYSNFGGLNCTGELDKVLQSFDALLNKGGIVSLVIISKFSLWESLLLLKGNFKTAFRRFRSKEGRTANVEGSQFKCWYYRPTDVEKNFKTGYQFLSIEGLCTIVPPSYFENFGKKYPKLFSFLIRKENKLKTKWPWKNCGDYFIISFRKIS